MTTFRVRFATEEFAVDLPAAAETALRRMYPAAAVVTGGARESEAPGRQERASFRVVADGPVWRLEEEGADLGRFATPAHALVALEGRWVELAARSTGRCVALHAGAVEVETKGQGRACVIAGNADSGKSSTTVQLVELGHGFLADEVVVVESATSRVLPLHRTPAIDARFVADRFGGGPVARGEVVEAGPGILRYVPRRVVGRPVEAAALLLPRYRPGAATVVEDLEAGEALIDVLGYCFAPLGEQEAVVDAVAGLLETWSIRRLTYGDAEAARAALTELFPPSRDTGPESP